MLLLLFSIASAIFAVNLIANLVNSKKINREKYFESQMIQTKRLRVINELPYYRSSDYQRYLGSWTWKIISKHAMQAMNGKCEFCGEAADAVHHIYYPKDRKDVGLEDISSLCVVCKRCHNVLHGQRHDKDKMCALCKNIKSDKTLHVKHNRLGRNKQLVCGRCYAIANGFRDEAYKWSWEKYTVWVNEWQKRVLDEMVLQRGQRKTKGIDFDDRRTS
jgi:hypothetical protein